jgi:hypothetical protein
LSSTTGVASAAPLFVLSGAEAKQPPAALKSVVQASIVGSICWASTAESVLAPALGEEPVMPRYHFHIDDHSTRDDDGVELADLEVAKCEAIRMAGRIICDEGETFWDRGEWSMTVSDETGLTLLHLQIIGTEAPATQAVARVQQAAGPEAN